MSNEDYVDETNNVDGFNGNLENPLRNGDELLDDDIFMDANLANAEVDASEPNEGAHFDQLDESYKIDGWEDIGKTEFLNIVDVDIKRYHFSDLGVDFDFYNAFAKSRGFSGRKSKTRKHNGIINRQNFVCCREGFRQKKADNMHTRKQEPRDETRCGCKAKVQVSFDVVSGRWIVSKFSDLHNHDLLPPIFTAMLPGHRKIPAADIEQINIMRKGGLGTAHIFAALSSQSVIVKYVKSRYNLRDFVEHFDRCVAYIRFKDSLADFECAHGVPVMQTHLLSLEKSAANLYTREVFFLFRPIIIRSGSMKVLDCIDVGSYMLYTVVKYGSPNDTWQVSFCDLPMEFTCSCMRMESFGIPCEHILSVLVTLDICELPKCLVLDRWTKNVKQQIQDTRGFTWDCLKSTQYWCLMDWFRLVATLSAGKDDRFRSMRDWAINTVDKMKADDIASAVASSSAIPATHTDPRDPPIRRRAKDRAGQRCSICRELGHNKTTCPYRSKYDRSSHERHNLPTDDDAYEAMWDEEEDFIYEEDEGECAVNSSYESSRDQDMEIDDSNYEFGNEDDGANEIN
ncbi:hypothetical protein Ahy_B06g080216 [Arachis hypogaea]|uniref:SWIM-type domain-containing protein n=1 Tax=Arachis hypogaea TaxID=3818 RepID=A0A444YHC4_ARAHY|nr:hypothetical protein Ahy_B06g080216 [Arachis hypogaea]